MPKARDYKQEYKDFHGKPEQIANRSDRNQARRKLGLSPGDGKEVDHKKPISKGGTNSKGNLTVTTRHANRKKADK